MERRVEAWKTTVQEEKNKAREGGRAGRRGGEGREAEGEAWKALGGATALQPLCCAGQMGRGRVPILGRMFWPRAADQWEARAGPLGRGRARARESVAQLKECVRRLPVVFR